MPKKIPMTEKREWLKESDEGTPAAQIARDKGKALKVIKRGIEEARAERDGAAARAEIVKDALKNHQKQLMSVIGRLMEASEFPPADLELRREKDGGLAPIPLPAGRIIYYPDQGLVLELHDEDTALWGLLREQLPRDRIWSTIRNWKSAYITHIKARTDYERAIKTLIEKETGIKVIGKNSSGDEEEYIDNAIVRLYFQVHSRRTLGISDEWDPEQNLIAADDGYIHNGIGGQVMVCSPENQNKYRETLITAFNKIPDLAEAKAVISTAEELKTKSNKLKRMLEDISLMGLVPGRCRICNRISL